MAKGKLGGGVTCFKYFVIAFNLICCLIGVALIGVSGWLVSTVPDLSSAFNGFDAVVAIPVVGIIIGFILTVTSLLGCFGSIKENTCLLKVYFGLMVLLLLMEIGIGAAIGVYNFNDEFKSFLDNQLEAGWATCEDGTVSHGTNSCLWQPALEKELLCCGFNYPSTPPAVDEPGYDCVTYFQTEGITVDEGCREKVLGQLEAALYPVLGTVGGIVFIQIIVMVGVCCLIRGIGDDSKYA